jgi:L-histidine N-alpha-methyltransferase
MAHAPILELPALSPLAEDVRAGLAQPQKSLPCKYLYDAVGTLLFEAICALPEYGLSHADQRLLQAHAGPIAAASGPAGTVLELGSGSARKTRPLLQALTALRPATYVPIEISEAAIERSRRGLEGIPGLQFRPLAMDYLEGLARSAERRRGRQAGDPWLVLFLGSTLGNFAPRKAEEFLRRLRQHLLPGDRLLLGLDLAKPAWQLRLAYDDPAGVTAAFNLNLLARLNRELGADFDLRQWQHQLLCDPRGRWVQMHLRSRRAQAVRLPGFEAPVPFRRGETIWTESSHKFEAEAIAPLLAAAGFVLRELWIDTQWPLAESLSVAI